MDTDSAIASLQDLVLEITADITSLNQEVAKKQLRLDSANLSVSQLQGILKTQIVGYVPQAQLDAANAQIADLQTQLDAANATIASLQPPPVTEPPITATS